MPPHSLQDGEPPGRTTHKASLERGSQNRVGCRTCMHPSPALRWVPKILKGFSAAPFPQREGRCIIIHARAVLFPLFFGVLVSTGLSVQQNSPVLRPCQTTQPPALDLHFQRDKDWIQSLEMRTLSLPWAESNYKAALPPHARGSLVFS